eukprot:GSChrysophyteH1.ASY1.ANO1.787.1 assembled CDS
MAQVIASQSQPILSDVPGAPSVGIRTLRSLRQSQQPSERLKKKIDTTYNYFLQEVDPVISETITYLLCEQPIDVPGAMLNFLNRRNELEKAKKKGDENKRPKKEHKLYLATSIGPIISKLVNRIATARPRKVVGFLCEELQTMIYGTEEEKEARLTTDVETDERFDMYKGQNGPRVNLKPTVQKIQFAVIGMDGSGKSSLMNMLQGCANTQTKPTIGFRPITMMVGEELQIRFYDIGGGPKIREIWPQYFHDVHGVIFVVDSSDTDRMAEAKTVFDSSLSHDFVQGKPLLVIGTKQDKEGAVGEEDIKQNFALNDILTETNVTVCKAVGEAEEVDARIEGGLEWLIKSAQDNFESLSERVKKDSLTKVKDDQKRRLARERKVLKNKISIAFMHLLAEEHKPDLGDKPPNPEDQFTVEEGLNFLSSELGEEVAALPQEALEISAMVGYQRLALQIVGSLKVPISKKKEPMSWREIHDLVVEIRKELGLLDPDFSQVGTFS